MIKGIYSITNKLNNKIYIGESKDIYERWEFHKDDLNNNSHHSYKLQEDWNKYGKDNFEFDIIKKVKCEDIYNLCLLIYEDKFIKEYNSVEDGYNCEYTLDKILSDEKKICELYPFLNIYNLMKLNNNELPNNIKEFIINNKSYFNYINKTVTGITNDYLFGEYKSELTIFNYIIKDEYKTLKCDYVLVYNEDLKRYLINNKCILIDTIINEEYPNPIYKFKAYDYEKYCFDWVIDYNTKDLKNIVIKDI